MTKKQMLLLFLEYLLDEGALADWMVDEDFEEWIDSYLMRKLPIEIEP